MSDASFLCFFRCLSFQKKEDHTITYGGLAQLGERLPCKQEVTSSNLVFSTQIMKRADGVGRQDSEPGLPERRRLYDNRRIFEEYP